MIDAYDQEYEGEYVSDIEENNKIINIYDSDNIEEFYYELKEIIYDRYLFIFDKLPLNNFIKFIQQSSLSN